VTPGADHPWLQPARLREAAQRGAQAMARQLARIPPGIAVRTGISLAATSLCLLFAGKRRASLLLGIGAAPILLAGLYERAARSAPTADRAHLH